MKHLSTNISIHGVGALGAFGCGKNALLHCLESNTPPTPTQARASQHGEQTIPAYLASTEQLSNYVPKRALRRMDHYSRLALLGAHLALEDARANGLETDTTNLGVIIASGYGATTTTFAFLDSVLEDGDHLASPTHFSHSVHNAAAANVAIKLRATGPNLTVSQFELSTASALATARHWLATKRVDAILFGTVDHYCDVLGYCHKRYFGQKHPGTIAPLELDKHTALPGEGACFFLLTRPENTSPYGYITDVNLGSLQHAPSNFTQSTHLLLGTDGHKACAKNYAPFLQSNTCNTYANYYGSLPTGQGFDMAIAALRLQQNAAQKFACLKFTSEQYAVIYLEKDESMLHG